MAIHSSLGPDETLPPQVFNHFAHIRFPPHVHREYPKHIRDPRNGNALYDGQGGPVIAESEEEELAILKARFPKEVEETEARIGKPVLSVKSR